MKIVCTEREKEQLINIMTWSIYCETIENIEWEIQNENDDCSTYHEDR